MLNIPVNLCKEDLAIFFIRLNRRQLFQFGRIILNIISAAQRNSVSQTVKRNISQKSCNTFVFVAEFCINSQNSITVLKVVTPDNKGTQLWRVRFNFHHLNNIVFQSHIARNFFKFTIRNCNHIRQSRRTNHNERISKQCRKLQNILNKPYFLNNPVFYKKFYRTVQL